MVNLAAIAGALLDLLAAWGQGTLFGIGAAIGVALVIVAARATGWWPE
ncbi:MAG: hypothetical protein KGH93_03645 [Patescibacteria group bacterium]|nr:hypothetical protein [Patescibacteria group bacterium]